MAHAIIRGKNGRQYELKFDDAPVRVEVHACEETVEIFVEPDFETHSEQWRRLPVINIRAMFSEATVGQRSAERRIINAAAADFVPLPASGRRHRHTSQSDGGEVLDTNEPKGNARAQAAHQSHARADRDEGELPLAGEPAPVHRARWHARALRACG